MMGMGICWDILGYTVNCLELGIFGGDTKREYDGDIL